MATTAQQTFGVSLQVPNELQEVPLDLDGDEQLVEEYVSACGSKLLCSIHIKTGSTDRGDEQRMGWVAARMDTYDLVSLVALQVNSKFLPGHTLPEDAQEKLASTRQGLRLTCALQLAAILRSAKRGKPSQSPTFF